VNNKYIVCMCCVYAVDFDRLFGYLPRCGLVSVSRNLLPQSSSNKVFSQQMDVAFNN
jgi:hypothetical protein